ncbi:hypothetical protein D3C78_1144430 [compost metagenome]
MGRGARGLFLALEVDAQRPFLELRKRGLAEHVALDHLRQHRVAPRQRALGVEHRVVIARALEHAHQGRRFQHAELVGRLVEIGARGHLYAIGVVEKGHGVEVGLEDFVLGVERLDLERRDRFLELARERGRAADFRGVEVARQLLGDGRSALPVTAQGVDEGRSRAPPVQAVVAVEAVVLGGDQGLDHGRRDLVERHPGAVAALEDRQFLAVLAQDLRRLLQPGLADIADAGRERNQHQHIQQAQGRNGRQAPGQLLARGPARARAQRGQPGPQAGGLHTLPCRRRASGHFQVIHGKTHSGGSRPGC